jgi:ADP-ribose pyrophosphatase
MLKRLRRLSTELLHKNPWWEYRRDDYLHPDDSRGEFYYVHTLGSVFVIPVLDDGRLILLRQFRYLNQIESLEFVGGGMKPNRDAEAMAREELREEAGYEAGSLTPIGWFNPMNGASDEQCYVFIARQLTASGPQPESSEEFEAARVTSAELDGLIKRGEIWDGMTLAAYALYKQHEA